MDTKKSTIWKTLSRPTFGGSLLLFLVVFFGLTFGQDAHADSLQTIYSGNNYDTNFNTCGQIGEKFTAPSTTWITSIMLKLGNGFGSPAVSSSFPFDFYICSDSSCNTVLRQISITYDDTQGIERTIAIDPLQITSGTTYYIYWYRLAGTSLSLYNNRYNTTSGNEFYCGFGTSANWNTGYTSDLYFAYFYNDSYTPPVEVDNNVIFFDNIYYRNITYVNPITYAFDPSEFDNENDYIEYKQCNSPPVGPPDCSDLTDLGTQLLYNSYTQVIQGIYQNRLGLTPPEYPQRIYYLAIPHKYGSSNLYKPVYFSVAWTTEGNIQGIFGTSTIIIGTDASSSNELDIDTRAWACTEEEWSATSTYLGLNLTQTACSIKKWVLDISFAPIKLVRASFQSLRDSLSGVFPFSILNTIKEEWTTNENTLSDLFSIHTALAAEADYFDDSGAYSGPLSIDIAFGSASTTVIVASKTQFESWFGADRFALFNTICRTLVWLVFLSYLYVLVVHRIPDILNH